MSESLLVMMSTHNVDDLSRVVTVVCAFNVSTVPGTDGVIDIELDCTSDLCPRL